MRIAIWHDLPSGGGKRALYDQVAALVGRGHHVEAWTTPTRSETFLPLSRIVPEHVRPFAYRQKKTLWQTVGLSSHSLEVARRLNEHCRICAREIDAGAFDLVLVHCSQFVRTPPIARYLNSPSVLYLQEPYRWLYEAMPTLLWAAPERRARLGDRIKDRRNVRDGRIKVREEIAAARAFTRILCNSYFSRESILRAYGLSSHVCYLGIDVERFAPGDADREPIVVGLGAITPEKGILLAMDAVRTMKVARPRLVWIGNAAIATWQWKMEQAAAAKGVDLEIKVGVSDEEVALTLARATAMVYPPRLEPFGYAPLEANACATPVVAISEGGVRETIVHEVNGLLADAEPAALAAGLDRLFADPLLARQLGARGREMVRSKWSQRAAIDRLEAQLEATLSAVR